MKKLRRNHENIMKVDYQTLLRSQHRRAASKGNCWIRNELLTIKKRLSLQDYSKELRKVFTGVVHTNPDFYMSTIQKSI